MAIFELPDGRQFDIPDSVPPEQAVAGLRAKFGQEEQTNIVQPTPLQPQTAPPVPTAAPTEQGSILDLFGTPPKTTEEQERIKQAVARFPAEVGQALTSRGTFQAAGGALGSVAGIPAGAPGVVAGGALGAAGGDALFNIIESAKNAFAGQEIAPISAKGVQEAFARPIKAAKEDITATLGLGAVGRAARGVAPLVGRAIGVATTEAKELAALATKLGVPLGAINVTPSEAVKGFAKVAGVFPFVGTPIRQAQQTAQTALDRSLDETLNAVAPTASLQEIGVNLTKAAESRFKAFRRLSGSLYDNFLNKAENATVPDIFPTANLKGEANKIKQLQAAGEITLEEGGKFGTVQADTISNFIENSTQLPERLTAQQIRALQRSLQETMSKASADGFDVSRGVQLKKALEADFNNPQVDLLNAQEGKELVDSLTTANKFFANNIPQFQTATTQKFGRIEKNIFKPKFFKAGSKEADEAFSAVFNSKSPQALENLRKVVGGKQFKQAVRKHLDTAVNKSVTEPASEGAARIFDPIKLEQQLGLATPEGRNVLKTMLKDTPLKISDLEDFVRVAKAVGSVEIGDVATFLKRKAVFEGLRGVAGGFAISQGVISPKGIALVVAAREGSKILSDPAKLKSLTTALDSTLTQKAQRSAVLRLIRTIPSGEEREVLINELNKGE